MKKIIAILKSILACTVITYMIPQGSNAAIGLSKNISWMTVVGASTLGTVFVADTASCIYYGTDLLQQVLCSLVPGLGSFGALSNLFEKAGLDDRKMYPLEVGIPATFLVAGVVFLDENSVPQVSLPTLSEERANRLGLSELEFKMYSEERELINALISKEIDDLFHFRNVRLDFVNKEFSILEDNAENTMISKESLSATLKIINNGY